MTKEEILKEITVLMHDIFENTKLTISYDSDASTVTGWDSIRNVKLLLAVEERFNIRLKTREIDRNSFRFGDHQVRFELG
jgi:acyl carrier protein